MYSGACHLNWTITALDVVANNGSKTCGDVGPATKAAKDAMRGAPREEMDRGKGEEEEGTKAEQSWRRRITMLTGHGPQQMGANHGGWKLVVLLDSSSVAVGSRRHPTPPCRGRSWRR
jgi:hypothetical protein